MSHTPHELAEDFPGAADRIRALVAADAHFARLVGEYHEVNRAVHRAETRVEPVSDHAETEMRARRSRLKDLIARTLAG
ncbi:MAG TPA: DUF465 domain-containing protein [Paracoccaceae bacterium]|nr:DUF465 domain-containing protein [Paracoccaceae bacterium]HMO73466.1 DUF465 domain-containing protein [Paracoccaceae bacterium]